MTVQRLPVGDHVVECEFLQAAGASAPTIVFLHEGLGSIAMWRDFPARVVQATGCGALLYSRRGHGASDPLATPHTVDFMHTEALEVLPALLDAVAANNPILFGHSSGASIALIHAGSAQRNVAGVIALAPHVIVETLTVNSIAAAEKAYQDDKLLAKLGRYHPDPRPVVKSWTDIWLTPAFRAWNIEDYVRGIRCPILAIQGRDDEYGTMDQIDRIAALAPDVDVLKLDDCGHSPHRDQRQAVIDATARFVARIRG